MTDTARIMTAGPNSAYDPVIDASVTAGECLVLSVGGAGTTEAAAEAKKVPAKKHRNEAGMQI